MNETAHLSSTVLGEHVPVDWHLENMDTYDPRANYSKLLYRQSFYDPPSKKYESGSYAPRRINVYGGENCSESDPEGAHILDWWGFDCFSEGEGACGTLPYNIASFYLMSGAFDDKDRQHGQCMIFAEMGAADTRRPLRAAVSAVLSAGFIIWLSM